MRPCLITKFIRMQLACQPGKHASHRAKGVCRAQDAECRCAKVARECAKGGGIGRVSEAWLRGSPLASPPTTTTTILQQGAIGRAWRNWLERCPPRSAINMGKGGVQQRGGQKPSLGGLPGLPTSLFARDSLQRKRIWPVTVLRGDVVVFAGSRWSVGCC